ncbi:bifunctional 3,4-dihydroxy-2-butanone-4-phosphate synthase/GTP cyclohydrolase II [Candidatus Peregrinibacteria bacterium CG_4_9_14_0_2_um_filter_53_11]|nr:MAG: bifunctional 3,4-dihydroxy-2-butanone-4-phosphate synthase/GTP cyclohydrolase II [Candidatus Peregrinibacteria bacterium CG_4_9_14_0_2_um_filter_53_11]
MAGKSTLTQRVDAAFSALKKGKLVVLADAEDRENEGDLIGAAETITSQSIAFMADNGRGLICAPLSRERAEALHLDLLPAGYNRPLQHCNFTISVDAVSGISTGISAEDRARTIRLLADPKTKPHDLSRPGHIFPLKALDGGVIERPGHTEGTIDLLKGAGLTPVGVLCEIMDAKGKMIRGDKLREFARKHKLVYLTILDLIAYRKLHEQLVERIVETRLPTTYGEFQVFGYKTKLDDKEHLALVLGSLSRTTSPLVRLHSECLTGDVFTSTRCDCHDQLHVALKAISEAGSGVLLYMRNEGRGIGLLNKLMAYNLQDKGLDTVEANIELGFPADARDYTVAAHILRDLGVQKLTLMTNNREKIAELAHYGLGPIKRAPLICAPGDNKELRGYLKTKGEKMGHMLDLEL